MNIKKIKIKGRTTKDIKELRKKIKKLGRTFLSKFIIQLTSKIVIPGIYLQILKYERDNRTRNEINKTLPFFETLGDFHDYINLKENNSQNNSSKIVLDLAWNSFYKNKKKKSIIKKANEEKNYFYLVLNGSVSKLNLIFKKEKVTMEEYILYIIKMHFLKENQILYKCNKLNSDIIHLDINNNSYICDNSNIVYNFKELKYRAKKDLKNEGFIFTLDDNIIIPSIEKYIKLSYFYKKEKNDTNVRYHLYIGHYIKQNNLTNGNFIGDLSKNENNEGSTYICNTKCDICYINKMEVNDLKLYDYIHLKMFSIFKDVGHKFYILKDTKESTYLNYLIPFMIYKSYKKGEKIILQNSQYEGVYFIIKGEVKISVSQSYNELSNTLVSLQYPIYNFKEYVTKIIKTIDVINEFNLKYIINNNKKNLKDLKENEIENEIFSSNEYFSYFQGINNIDFYTLTEGDIIGLNELYDFKTELYNFNAECISNEAILFFISKKDFNNVIKKDSDIRNNVIQLVHFKAKTLVGKINLHRNNYKNHIIKTLKKKEKQKLINNNSCINLNVKKYNNEKLSKKDLTEYNILTKQENKQNSKNIKLFKNNYLMKYLLNKNIGNNSTINYENYKININEKSTNVDNLLKNYKIKSNYANENYNLNKSNFFKKNKSCMNLSTKNFNDSNLKIKENNSKLQIKKNMIRNRHSSFMNQSLYYNNKSRNKVSFLNENKINFSSTNYSNFPLIKTKK